MITNLLTWSPTWHKSALAVLGKMSVVSGSTCNCYLTKPINLTLPDQSKKPCPNPAGSYLNLPQPTTQTLVARLLILEVTKIW